MSLKQEENVCYTATKNPQ